MSNKLELNLVPFIVVCKECNSIYIPSNYEEYVQTDEDDLPKLPCGHVNKALYKHDNAKVKITEKHVEEMKAIETVLLETVCKMEGLEEKLREAVDDVTIDVASVAENLADISIVLNNI